ncbi:MAG: response regulator [Pirellulales bacterium]|nr:response regulator [Pirellulales bacterium]
MLEKTVLLAEDDAGHVALFRRATADSGVECRLEVVHDGVEVIDFLFATGQYKGRDSHDLPDLILLDLKMPKMGGLQVLQVLRRVRGEDHTRFPPVVVLTSSDLDADVKDAYRFGAQSYIRKPLDYPLFAAAVRETLQYWLGLNRPVPRYRASMHCVHNGL